MPCFWAAVSGEPSFVVKTTVPAAPLKSGVSWPEHPVTAPEAVPGMSKLFGERLGAEEEAADSDREDQQPGGDDHPGALRSEGAETVEQFSHGGSSRSPD